MSTVRELHHQAMALAQDADMERDPIRRRALLNEALPLECLAAKRLANERASEPTRSILYLSAASLAYMAERYDESLALIADGQAGWPSPRTAYDLDDLKTTVTRLRVDPT